MKFTIIWSLICWENAFLLNRRIIWSQDRRKATSANKNLNSYIVLLILLFTRIASRTSISNSHVHIKIMVSGLRNIIHRGTSMAKFLDYLEKV